MKKVIPINPRAFPQPQTLLGVLQDMNLEKDRKIERLKLLFEQANNRGQKLPLNNLDLETVISFARHKIDGVVIRYHRLYYVVPNALPSLKVTMTSNIDQLSIKRTEKGDALKLTGNFTFNFNLANNRQFSFNCNLHKSNIQAISILQGGDSENRIVLNDTLIDDAYLQSRFFNYSYMKFLNSFGRFLIFNPH
ncbi:MAG: hypothetical protein ACON35_01045 [Candidatus Marinamargulisbacteria bacterium]